MNYKISIVLLMLICFFGPNRLFAATEIKINSGQTISNQIFTDAKINSLSIISLRCEKNVLVIDKAGTDSCGSSMRAGEILSMNFMNRNNISAGVDIIDLSPDTSASSVVLRINILPSEDKISDESSQKDLSSQIDFTVLQDSINPTQALIEWSLNKSNYELSISCLEERDINLEKLGWPCSHEEKFYYTESSKESLKIYLSDTKSVVVKVKLLDLSSGNNSFKYFVLSHDLNGLRELSIKDGSVVMSYNQPAKLLGFFPGSLKGEIIVSSSTDVQIKMPWFNFLYLKDHPKIKDLQEDILTTLKSTGLEKSQINNPKIREEVIRIVNKILNSIFRPNMKDTPHADSTSIWYKD